MVEQLGESVFLRLVAHGAFHLPAGRLSDTGGAMNSADEMDAALVACNLD